MLEKNLMAGTGIQEGATSFICPNCEKQEIVRSMHSKETGIKYKCPKCEFEGP